MTEPAAPRVTVDVGDVSHSQLVFGDHNTIQTPKGTKVTILQVGERPVPRLRPMPLIDDPALPVEIVDRDEELQLAASAAAGVPLQVYAPEGAGKTALLRAAAQKLAAPSEGVVFRTTRRRTLDEIQAALYAAFWESDVPFLPSPAEVGGFLTDREALVLLDDCGLDRDDLDTLLESVPRSTVVTASAERTLWSRGTAHALTGLDPPAALRLLERELGHSIDAGERPAAEALAGRLDGHPQSLVETAALIGDGRATFRELADDPAALERRIEPSALSSSQRRVLEVLAALGGAALGVEHVAALADLSDPAHELQELERRGWVKSASPRYRLVRPPPDGLTEASEKELLNRVLDHLALWTAKAKPSAVADEAEAVAASLELGAAARHWKGALTLSLAAEGKLAVAGSWTRWERVLSSGLAAARELEDEAAEAHLLHQLGSRSLCLGAQGLAVTQLTEALGIRGRLEDHAGAELTRHNLGQIGGGGTDGGRNGGGGHNGGWWPPPVGPALAVLGALAVALVAVVLATGGDGGDGGETDGVTNGSGTTTNDNGFGPLPTIIIEQPKDGAEYNIGDHVPASYECTFPQGAPPPSCKGTVADGAPIDTETPGSHVFTVTATDDAGRVEEEEVNYSVEEPKQTDTVAPEIVISSPADGERYVQGSEVLASFTCTDEPGGSGIDSCVGTVPDGTGIDTATSGPRGFNVVATDNAGNVVSENVTYSVYTID